MADDIRPVPVRPPPRARRRPRTPNPQVRLRLLAAASELIGRQGVPQLRVEEVAEKAGLSVGTFYLYFDGKADLFAALVVAYTEQLRVRLRAAYEAEAALPERLAQALDAYLDFVEQNQKGFLYFKDAGTIETTVGPLSSWALRQHAEDLIPLLEEGTRSGELRPEDPELTAQAVLGLAQHIAGYWLEHRDRIGRDTVRRFLLTTAALGLRGERTAPEASPDGEANPEGEER